MKWRKSLYDIIEVNDEQNTISKLYDWMMMIVIVASIIPLAVRNANELTQMLDFVTVIIFIIDEKIALIVNDFRTKKLILVFSYLINYLIILILFQKLSITNMVMNIILMICFLIV